MFILDMKMSMFLSEEVGNPFLGKHLSSDSTISKFIEFNRIGVATKEAKNATTDDSETEQSVVGANGRSEAHEKLLTVPV